MAKSHFVGDVVYFAHHKPLLSCSTFLALYMMSGLWTKQMWSCLKKLLVVHNQTHVFISHHSSLLCNQQGCQQEVMTATFVESISRGLSPTLLKIWHVNLITYLVMSMQQQQWHPTSQMTAAMWTPTSHVLQGASRSCLNLRSPSTYESHWILQLCNESSTPIAQCQQQYQLGWTWWQNANDSRDHANLTEID